MFTKHPFLAMLLIALTVGWGASADVYLSTGGNDGNDGLSAGAPKLTLGAAITVLNTQAAPTTLHIAAGTYTANNVYNVTVVGSAGNLVTIQGEGGTVTLRQSVLRVSGAYTTLKDLTLDAQNLHEACVVVLSSAAHCTVQTCILTGVMEQASEHFNPDSTEFIEPIDVAPVQVMAANQATITGCVFNATGQTWDYAVLLPSAAGGAQDLTVTGCAINGDDLATGGVKLLRQCFNLQVLNTQFNSMVRESVSLESDSSGVASGTSIGMLVQGCWVDGCPIVDSQRGAIEVFHGQVQDFTVRNVSMTRVSTGGADGVKIVSSGAINVLVENLTFYWPTGGSTGVAAVSVTNHDGNSNVDGLAGVCNVTGLTMRNVRVPQGGGLLQYWNYPRVTNTLVENCVASRPVGTSGRNCIDMYNGTNVDGVTVRNCNLSWPGGADAWAIYSANTLATNIVYENCTVYAYNNGFVSADCPISNVTIKNCNIRTVNWHAIHFFRAGNNVNNVHISDCQLVGTGANTAPSGIVMADGPATHVDIRNCKINGMFNAIMFWFNITVTDLTVADCDIWSGTGDLTWGANITSRVGNVSIVDATFENLKMRGYRGFGFYDFVAGVPRQNIVIRNCDVLEDRNAFYSGVGNPENNTLIEDCTFVAIRPATTTLEAQAMWIATNITGGPPSVFNGLTMNRCYVAGTNHGVDIEDGAIISDLNVTDTIFSASDWNGFFIEQGSNVSNATFTNCLFENKAGINDTTEKRPGGFLMEDAGSTLSGAGFHNCTFQGGQCGLALQRYQIQLGAGEEPIAQNLFFDNCTFRNARERGVGLQFSKGGNVHFKNPTLQNINAVGTSAFYADFNGDKLMVEGLTLDGGGTAAGMRLQTSVNFEAQNWLVRDSNLTNLGGIGMRIRPSLKNSTISGVTLTGAAGSSHGIFIDNQLSSYAGAKLAHDITLSNNVVGDWDGDGIRANGSNHVITGCTVTNAGGAGISLPDDSSLRPANTGVQCNNCSVSDCAGPGLLVEGGSHNLSNNELLRNGQGILVRSGLSGLLAAESSTTGNLITRNCVFGGVPASATGISEALNPGFAGDPGPSFNVYLNNTVTDFTQGTEFLGQSNRIQNNIFFFNTNTDFRVLPAGLGGLRAGWNCAGRQSDTRFDGLYVDFTKDIWYNPSLVSRNPADAAFYRLTPGTSPCLDQGTGNGLVADGVTDLGCIETGTSEVASWRLY